LKKWRPLFGALAALCVAIVSYDAYAGMVGYPLYHALFDGMWKAAVSTTYFIATTGAAVFGYLAGIVGNAKD
jgi:hypothetical protein